MCRSFNVNFLTIRLWSSIWLLLMALVTTALEGAFLLKYITRFTEDIFSTLISVIFIGESVKFIKYVSCFNCKSILISINTFVYYLYCRH